MGRNGAQTYRTVGTELNLQPTRSSLPAHSPIAQFAKYERHNFNGNGVGRRSLERRRRVLSISCDR